MQPAVHADAVRRYYDDNTRRFLQLGQGTEGTIRRAVWGPGVSNRTEAMAYVDRLILEELSAAFPATLPATVSAPTAAPGVSERPWKIADLGCGVGASLCRLARQVPIEGLGVTLSGTQVELARRRASALGLGQAVRFLQADFCALPADVNGFDGAFAIEAFVHAASSTAFFDQAARLLRPGGLLLVCDDFLANEEVGANPSVQRWLERYRQGWLLGSLVSLSKADELAAQHGFRPHRSHDLTAFLEINRPRDIALDALMQVLGWAPIRNSYWGMLRGGNAAQRSLKRGWLQHRLVVWQRT
jgi:ubiquinone/menaquinone biosynthesis C-methylase UbiE